MFIASRTLLAQRSCLWITVGILLVRNAATVLDSTYVMLMASIFEVPMLEEKDGLAAACGMLLAIMAASDIPVISLDNYLEPLSSIVSLRLTVYFALVGYTFVFPGTALSCSPFFAFAFTDTVLNFLIFLAIRNERNEMIKTVINSSSTSQEEL